MRRNLALADEGMAVRGQCSSGFSSVTKWRARQPLISSLSTASVVDMHDTQSSIFRFNRCRARLTCFRSPRRGQPLRELSCRLPSGCEGRRIIVDSAAAGFERDDRRYVLRIDFSAPAFTAWVKLIMRARGSAWAFKTLSRPDPPYVTLPLSPSSLTDGEGRWIVERTRPADALEG
jgi:hypothetical protein